MHGMSVHQSPHLLACLKLVFPHPRSPTPPPPPWRPRCHRAVHNAARVEEPEKREKCKSSVAAAAQRFASQRVEGRERDRCRGRHCLGDSRRGLSLEVSDISKQNQIWQTTALISARCFIVSRRSLRGCFRIVFVFACPEKKGVANCGAGIGSRVGWGLQAGSTYNCCADAFRIKRRKQMGKSGKEWL